MALNLILSSLSLLLLTEALETPDITDLSTVINPHLSGGKVKSYTSKIIKVPGPDYGTINLAISASISQSKGKLKKLALVAKLPPINDESLWHVYRPERACITENSIYKYFAAEIYKLEEEKKLGEKKRFTGLKRYYGSRISLEPDATEVDHDAVLVLEDVLPLGYKYVERHALFKGPQIQMAVETMARFHATGIALRLEKPEFFDQYVRPYVGKFNILLEDEQKIMADEVREIIAAATGNTTKAMAGIKEAIEQYEDFLNSYNTNNDTLFTTVLVTDLWNTNFAVKYQNKVPVSMKMFNFQYAQYGTMMHDFHFLLFTSVDPNALKKNIFDLFGEYHTAFIKRLKSLRVDLWGYQFIHFLKEIRRVFPIELPRIIYRLKVDFDSHSLPKEVDESDLVAVQLYRRKHLVARVRALLSSAREERMIDW